VIKLHNPEDILWTDRCGALATVHLSISYDRYLYGEICIETTYQLLDGSEDGDPASRINLSTPRREVITAFWDTLFDAMLIAMEFAVEDVLIDYQVNAKEPWSQDLLVIAWIVAHELDVKVSGACLPTYLIAPSTLLNLSDDLSQRLFGSESHSDG
jgi:hypothetical protein